jgi:hypothetical protein
LKPSPPPGHLGRPDRPRSARTRNPSNEGDRRSPGRTGGRSRRPGARSDSRIGR